MRPLSAILPAVLDRKRNRSALFGLKVQDAWFGVVEEVVGEAAAMGSSVEALRGDTLIVRTASSALSTELRLYSKQIFGKLNSLLPRPMIRKMRFRG
ncbi:MAG: DUF721 domain-containing protein [bacterium]|nr:DUF721 domain-containing protein [bacterium]